MPIALSDYLAWLRQSTTVPVVSPARDRRPPEAEQASPGETGQGSSPETSDQSVGGRIALSNALNDPTSLANATLGLMGTLAGPLGGLVGKVATMAMAAHNNAQLNAIAQNTPVGVRGLNADDNDPAAAVPPDIPDDTLSVNPDDPTGDAAAAAAAAAASAAAAAAGQGGNTGVGTGQGPAGESGGPSGSVYEQGGVVRDRQPGLQERITAHQGEFVVKRGPATKYRRLLEAINADDPKRIRKAATLKEAMTRA